MKTSLIQNLLVSCFVLIYLLSFSSCSAQTNESADKNESENLSLLEYCELRNNPDKYDGKIVRLKTKINGGQHGEYLSDWRCPADEPNPAYYDAAAAVIYKNREDGNKITKIREQRIENKNSRSQYTDPVYVTMIGLFKKNTLTGKDSSYERSATFHFIVNSIESFEKDDDTKAPVVEYCELKNNPRKYDGKIIRIEKANLYWFMHGYFLADEKCSSEDDSARTAIGFYEPDRDILIEKLNRTRSKRKINEPFEINVVGKFTYKNLIGNSDHIQDRTHLQFEIFEFESDEQ